jgi:hypothetical protein
MRTRMRTALRALGAAGVVGLLGLSGCVTVHDYPVTTKGWGGTGIDLLKAEEACKASAEAMGRTDLNWVEEVRFSGPSTARIRFDRLGWFHTDAICYYDINTGAASVR